MQRLELILRTVNGRKCKHRSGSCRISEEYKKGNVNCLETKQLLVVGGQELLFQCRKKGNKKLCESYRSITVLNCILKMYK
jgi:hypothetical protein